MAIPVLCGQRISLNRPEIRLDAANAYALDIKRALEIKSVTGKIFLLIDSFTLFVRSKKKRIRHIIHSAERYLPKFQNGRFTQISQDPKDHTLAVGLSVFDRFLRYAVREGWLEETSYQSVLQHFWSLTFPGSQPADESLTAPDAWKSPDCFWRFLEEYLGQVLVAAPDEKRSAETGAAVVQIKDEYLLIVPNANTAYADWLSKNDIPGPAQSGKWEIKVFHALLDAGIPMRTEKERDQWRYAFSGAKEYCCGIALPHLHEPVLTVLRGKFGATLDRWVPNLSSDGSLEGGEV